MNRNSLSLKFIISCPPQCVCKSSQPREWYHDQCSKPLYITSNGDIYCYQTGCSSKFVKDHIFQCQEAKKNSSFYQYKSASHVMMAVAQAIQSGEFTFNGQDLQNFSTTLQSQILSRWFES